MLDNVVPSLHRTPSEKARYAHKHRSILAGAHTHTPAPNNQTGEIQARVEGLFCAAVGDWARCCLKYWAAPVFTTPVASKSTMSGVADSEEPLEYTRQIRQYDASAAAPAVSMACLVMPAPGRDRCPPDRNRIGYTDWRLQRCM